jgi:hypothetical protein
MKKRHQGTLLPFGIGVLTPSLLGQGGANAVEDLREAKSTPQGYLLLGGAGPQPRWMRDAAAATVSLCRF